MTFPILSTLKKGVNLTKSYSKKMVKQKCKKQNMTNLQPGM